MMEGEGEGDSNRSERGRSRPYPERQSSDVVISMKMVNSPDIVLIVLVYESVRHPVEKGDSKLHDRPSFRLVER